MVQRLHIFDVDHTLVRGSSGRHFITTAIREGVLPRSVLLSLPVIYFRYRLGKLKPSHINRDLPQLEGIDRKKLEEVSRVAFERKLRPAIFTDAERYIRDLHKKGEETALATSSVDIIVEPLASYLAVDTIIASSVEFDGHNRCTGRFIDGPTFGEEKRQRVLAHLETRGIDPGECAFYSDSIYDLPLLESVGFPVPVNPDVLLGRHAKQAGWRVMSFS